MNFTFWERIKHFFFGVRLTQTDLLALREMRQNLARLASARDTPPPPFLTEKKILSKLDEQATQLAAQLETQSTHFVDKLESQARDSEAQLTLQAGTLLEEQTVAKRQTETQLTDLTKEMRKLGKTQFKANTVQEAQIGQQQETIEHLQKSLAQQEKTLAEMKQIREQAVQTAQLDIVKSVLPTLDSLDAAFESGRRQVLNTPMSTEVRRTVEAWVDGIRLTRIRLLDVLAAHEVKPIPSVGTKFDPHYHIAIATDTRAQAPEGTIVAEDRRGYATAHTVLRGAEVVVAREETNMTSLPKITIYTDGGCNPNPGPGGWAAILLYPDQTPQELAGGVAETTNNQMELQAAIEALNALAEPHRIAFFTDSQYLHRGVTEWLPTGKTAVKNKALWQQLARALNGHDIDWHWTKGHAGDHWNERADVLARAQIPRSTLPLDDEQAIHLFTGAAYSGKRKTGGWAILLRYRTHTKIFHGQEKQTSANRMHLQAAIEGLKMIKNPRPIPIHLYTASDYVKNGATQWVRNWKANRWQTKGGKAVSNRDLWEALDLMTQQHAVTWHVVPKEGAVREMVQVKNVAVQASRQDG